MNDKTKLPIANDFKIYLKLASHGVRFATARLAVSEARGHSALENGLHQRPGRVAVHSLVVAILIKGTIEAKLLIVQLLGQIHLKQAANLKSSKSQLEEVNNLNTFSLGS